MGTPGEQLLPFAQLDLAGGLSLADGRYLARETGDQPRADVLVIRTLGAPRAASRLRRGKPAPVETAPDPTPLPLSRITLIKAIPFDDEKAAGEWLERVRGDDELARGLAKDTAYTANRALQAHRVAAPDPYLPDINPGEAINIRFGYGVGEELAESRWQAAMELPENKRKGLRAEIIDGVGAQERVAGVLSGRDLVRPHEALLVDAERAYSERRLDLAVITARAALEAAGRAGVMTEEAKPAIGSLAERAFAGTTLDNEEVRVALRAARKAIRARKGEG